MYLYRRPLKKAHSDAKCDYAGSGGATTAACALQPANSNAVQICATFACQ